MDRNAETVLMDIGEMVLIVKELPARISPVTDLRVIILSLARIRRVVRYADPVQIDLRVIQQLDVFLSAVILTDVLLGCDVLILPVGMIVRNALTDLKAMGKPVGQLDVQRNLVPPELNVEILMKVTFA